MTANLFIALWVMGCLIWWSYRIGWVLGEHARLNDEWRDAAIRKLEEKWKRIDPHGWARHQRSKEAA